MCSTCNESFVSCELCVSWSCTEHSTPPTCPSGTRHSGLCSHVVINTLNSILCSHVHVVYTYFITRHSHKLLQFSVSMYMNNHVYRTPFSDIEIKKEIAKSKERRKEIHNFINY